MQNNRKIMLNETNNCTKINLVGKISCKKKFMVTIFIFLIKT